MSGSYKFVLIASAVLCALVLGYYVMPRGGETEDPLALDRMEQDDREGEAAERPTLRDAEPAQPAEREEPEQEPDPEPVGPEPAEEPATPGEGDAFASDAGPDLFGESEPAEEPEDESASPEAFNTAPPEAAPHANQRLAMDVGDPFAGEAERRDEPATEDHRDSDQPGEEAEPAADDALPGPASAKGPLEADEASEPVANTEAELDADEQPEADDVWGGAAEADDEPAEEAEARTYEVRQGDTFSSIARDQFGHERHWIDIARENPTVDPAQLQVGDTIRLPADVERERADDADLPDRPEREMHTVRSGQTLSDISREHYGTPHRWERIFEANRETLAGDPHRVRPGMELYIPPE